MTANILAIAALWPLALIVLLGGAMVVFRKQIRMILERFSKLTFKRGQTELLLESTQDAAVALLTARPNPLPSPAQPPTLVPDKPEEPVEKQDDPGSFRLMLNALRDGRLVDAHKAFEVLQSSESDAIARLRLEVFYRALRYVDAQDTSSIDRIEKLAGNGEIRAFALGWLGWAFHQTKSFERATEAYRMAIEASITEDERAQHVSSLSELHLGVNDAQEAFSLLSGEIPRVTAPEAKRRLYKALAAVLEKQDDKLMRAVVLEKALELTPTESDLRFSAAYAASAASLPHVAAVNYEAIINSNPKSAAALNNLGVQADGFTLPIKSVHLYRAADDEGYTLATANLSYKLLGQGFLTEARERLEKCKAVSDVHPNVNGALAECARREEAETKKWAAILRVGASHKVFLHKFADRRFSAPTSGPGFAGPWQLSTGLSFTSQLEGDRFVAIWGSGSAKRKLEGTITNGSVLGVVKKWQASYFAEHGANRSEQEQGFFEYGGDTALAYVTADGLRMEVLTLKDDAPQIDQFKRPAPTAGADGSRTQGSRVE